jgi:hypothetical protein
VMDGVGLAKIADDGVGVEIDRGAGIAAGGKLKISGGEANGNSLRKVQGAEANGVGKDADTVCGECEGGVVSGDERDGRRSEGELEVGGEDGDGDCGRG